MANPLKGTLSLSDLRPDEDSRPKVALFAVDADGKLLHRAEVGEDGRFEIPGAAADKAARIYVAPAADDLSTIPKEQLSAYRPATLRAILESGGLLDIDRSRWITWLGIRRCVGGKVRHCIPYPWVITDFLRLAQAPSTGTARTATTVTALPRLTLVDPIRVQPSIDPTLVLRRCEPVCEGIVEVYERTCCCKPWIVRDPRFDDLIVHLEDLVRELPPRPPRPDPPPIRELSFLKSGTLDPLRLNAARDLAALRELDSLAQVEYVNARPYLLCFRRCGEPRRVGQGFVHLNGEFTVCWQTPLVLLRLGCHLEYSFVVKQVIDGQEVTIYDGLSAGRWFHADDDIDLVSYHPDAIGCDRPGIEDDGTRFAVLERIGDTDSYNLDSPLPASENSVNMPGPNGGLAFPVAGDAAGQYQNRNWGGTLPLYFFFSESLKDVATRYRVSVVAANPDGTAAGTPKPLNGAVTWRRYVTPAPGQVATVAVPLGPDGDGLFTIPYFADGPWVGGRYHAYLDTTALPEGPYLVILELFGAAGNRVTPTADGFTFRRWVAKDAPFPAVTTNAMPHLFWWDNRRSVSEITGVSGGTATGTPTCQFIEGTATTPIRVHYRAYHPEQRFQLNHVLYWWKGIGSALQSWPLDDPATVPNESVVNIGQSGSPGQSQPLSIGTLLGTQSACSFGLRSRTHVKTFNGSTTLDGLEGTDQAAFALSQS